jgi:hypothetical protein
MQKRSKILNHTDRYRRFWDAIARKESVLPKSPMKVVLIGGNGDRLAVCVDGKKTFNNQRRD